MKKRKNVTIPLRGFNRNSVDLDVFTVNVYLERDGSIETRPGIGRIIIDPRSGTLQLQVTVTGDTPPSPADFQFTIYGPEWIGGLATTVGGGSSKTINVAPGDYRVTVGEIPDDYTLVGISPSGTFTIGGDETRTVEAVFQYTTPAPVIPGTEWTLLYTHPGSTSGHVSLVVAGDYVYAGFEDGKVMMANKSNLSNWTLCTMPGGWGSVAVQAHVTVVGSKIMLCKHSYGSLQGIWVKAAIGSSDFNEVAYNGSTAAGRAYLTMRGIDSDYFVQTRTSYGTPNNISYRTSDTGTVNTDIAYDGNRGYCVRPTKAVVTTSRSGETTKIYYTSNINTTDSTEVYTMPVTTSDVSCVDYANGEFIAIAGTSTQQSNGVSRSTNGTSWSSSGNSLPSTSYPAITAFKVLNPSAPNTAGLAVRKDGVWRSVDGFSTWANVLSVSPAPDTGAMADIGMFSDGTVILGYAGRIYKSVK